MPETRWAQTESGSSEENCGWLAEMIGKNGRAVDVDGGSAAKPTSVNQPIRRFVTTRVNWPLFPVSVNTDHRDAPSAHLCPPLFSLWPLAMDLSVPIF